jgi:hypothetical protein
MTEVVLNGGFEINTPPSTFSDWNVQPPVLVGVGTGVGGTDCAEIRFNLFGNGGGLTQFQNDILTPSTDYNLSCFINVTGVHPGGAAIYNLQCSFPSTPSLNFTGAVGIGMAFAPIGVYVQYTTIITSSAFGSTPHNVTFSVSAGGPFYGGPDIPVLFDNVSLIGLEVCMAGDTLIAAKNIETSLPVDIPVKDLVPSKHMVFSHTYNEYVKLIDVITSGPVNRIYELPIGTLSDSQYQKILVTGGHMILLDGNETKVRQVPNAKRIRCEPSIPVYTVILEKDGYIIANGGPVKASGHKEFNAYRDIINV